MEQVPHWLEVTVFAAGMTAFAEELAPTSGPVVAMPADLGTPVPPAMH
jgi:hypothetical protein